MNQTSKTQVTIAANISKAHSVQPDFFKSHFWKA